MILFLLLIIFQLIFDKIAGRFEKKLDYISSVICKSAVLLTVTCFLLSIAPNNYEWVSNRKFEINEVISDKNFCISTPTDSTDYIDIEKERISKLVCDKNLKKSFIEATGYMKVSKNDLTYSVNVGSSHYTSYRLYLTTSDYEKYTEDKK